MSSMRKGSWCLLLMPLMVAAAAAVAAPVPTATTPAPIVVATASSPDSFLLPVSAVAADGSLAVAWSVEVTANNSANVHLRRFDAAGAPIGKERVVNLTGSSGGIAIRNSANSIGADAAGNVVVAWYQITDQTSDLQLKARLFNADGSPRSGEFCIDPACSGLFIGNSRMLVTDDGRFVVTYTLVDGSTTLVLARRFAADGAPLDAQPIQVLSSSHYMGYSAAINRQTGDFTVGWQSTAMSGRYIQHNVRKVTTFSAQRYRADGTPVGGVLSVVSCLGQLSWFHGIEAGCQLFDNGQVMADNNGNLTFAWSQFSARSNTAPVTYVRHFDATSTAVGSSVQLAGSMINGAAGDGAGHYVLKLDSGTRAYDADDHVLETVHALDLSSSLSGSSSGGFVGSWLIANQDSYAVYAQPYTLGHAE